jgi:hypothetical protein
LEFLQGDSIKGGIARLSVQINQILRSHVGSRWSIYLSCGKTHERIIVKATQEQPESLSLLALILRKAGILK